MGLRDIMAGMDHRPGFIWFPFSQHLSFWNRIRLADFRTMLEIGLNSPRKFMTLYVPPKDIGRVVVAPGFGVHRKKSPQVLLGGDWDRDALRWEDRTENETGAILAGMRARILDGVSWEETGLYDRMERLIARHGSYDRCCCRDDIVRRYAALDGLIAFARAHGRLRHRAEIGPGFRELGGIDVAMGRDGEVLKSGGGGHRLAVAQVLDLPVIPVCVNIVHPLAVSSGHWKRRVAASRALQGDLNPRSR
jgi:hypothetical protein